MGSGDCAGNGVVTRLSEIGRSTLAHLGLSAHHLSERDREAVVSFSVACLEAMVLGRPLPYPDLIELPFGPVGPGVIITLSGGVGDLAYREDVAMETFDDLGPRLARGVRASPVLGRHLATHAPAQIGAATVLGLALFSTEHAGATVYAPVLPADDQPILARVRAADPDAFRMAGLGGAIQLVDCPTDAAGVRRLAERIAAAMTHRALVLLVDADIGLILGTLVTHWGSRSCPLVVLDLLAPRPARIVRLRRDARGNVNVRYFGFV